VVDIVLSRLEIELHIWVGTPKLGAGITKNRVMPRKKKSSKKTTNATQIILLIIAIIDLLKEIFSCFSNK